MKKKIKIISFISLILMIMTGCSTTLVEVNNINDLEDRNVGIYTGSEYDTILNKKVPSAKASYYNSYSDQISALKAGKIDGFLTDEPLAKEILKECKKQIFAAFMLGQRKMLSSESDLDEIQEHIQNLEKQLESIKTSFTYKCVQALSRIHIPCKKYLIKMLYIIYRKTQS